MGNGGANIAQARELLAELPRVNEPMTRKLQSPDASLGSLGGHGEGPSGERILCMSLRRRPPSPPGPQR